MENKKYDVAIIGGGPAGSTAATLLSRSGINCVVFEKEIFPRPHVGESLLPFCYDLFKELGVLEEVRSKSIPKPGVRFLDGNGDSYSNYCFSHYIKGPSAISSHVDRAQFDKILLDNAKKNGVEVQEGTKVKSVAITSSDVKILASNDDGEKSYTADFLIDASGQNTFLAKRFKQKEKMTNLDRTAFSAHWHGGKMLDGLSEGIQQIAYVGEEKQGWIWVIPINENRLSIGVVLNSNYVKSQKSKFAGQENWQEAFYREELKLIPYAQKILAESTLASPVNLNGNYSYTVTKKYGARYALIGDSGTFIDPIFATGVYLAMKSSFLVSKSIIESKKNNSNEINLDSTYRSINGAYALIERLIRQYYNPKAINFHELDGHFEKTDSALGIMHHILAGDFFDKYEQYDAFLTKLENEKHFARYKNLVFEKNDLEGISCKH
jgi:flavin-dependent dehydrogenase